MQVLGAQLCPTLCDPMDCSLPGSSVCGILQARILEWVAISSSRGSSRPRDGNQVSCIIGGSSSVRATKERGINVIRRPLSVEILSALSGWHGRETLFEDAHPHPIRLPRSPPAVTPPSLQALKLPKLPLLLASETPLSGRVIHAPKV